MVLKRLAPGIYDDGQGGCHLDLVELLVACGYSDTPENRETLHAAAAAVAREQGLETIIITIDIRGDDPAWVRHLSTRASVRASG